MEDSNMFSHYIYIYIYIYTYIYIYIYIYIYFIKFVLKPKCVLVFGQLWLTFLIHFKCWLLYYIYIYIQTHVAHMTSTAQCVWTTRPRLLDITLTFYCIGVFRLRVWKWIRSSLRTLGVRRLAVQTAWLNLIYDCSCLNVCKKAFH